MGLELAEQFSGSCPMLFFTQPEAAGADRRVGSASGLGKWARQPRKIKAVTLPGGGA
jgi:hypothetical protein